MNSDIISKSILDEIEDVVYIADPITYELYYVNGKLHRELGCPSESEWHRKKCYKVLQGQDSPCAFCTNDKICQEKFYNWEHYNEWLDRYYDIQDKLVIFDGIEARLEVAKDVTTRKLLEQSLNKKLEEQEALNKCIGTLHTPDSPEDSIDKLLALLASYYEAERGYIFMLEEEDSVINNKYEWCSEGIEPMIDMLQGLNPEIVSHWFKKYEDVGEFYIDSLHEVLEKDSEEIRILESQGIESLVTAPLRNLDKKIIGFIGVDNPRRNIDRTNVIRAVTSFVADFIDKNEQLEMLHRLSYYDSLTGMQNRHSYSKKIVELQEEPPNTLGIVYVDINGLKAVNDKSGHKEGDAYIRKIANFLKDIYTDCAYRIGGDEFVMICSEKEAWCFENRLAQLHAFIDLDEYPRAAVGYEWREGNCNVTEQIEIADKAMYEVKREQYAKYSGKSEIFRQKYLVDASHHN